LGGKEEEGRKNAPNPKSRLPEREEIRKGGRRKSSQP